MSAFYPNSTSQVDVIPTSYVQDQKFTSYSEPPIINGNNMMMYLHGASSNGSFSELAPEASMAGRHEMMFIQPNSDHIPMQTFGGQPIDGGLSLSLSTQFSNAIPPASFDHFSKVDEGFQNSMRFGAPNNIGVGGYSNVQQQYEQAGGARVIIMKSRFLKVTQELLDEIVSVQDGLKQPEPGKDQSMKKVEDENNELKEQSAAASDVNDSASEQLSATERQDLQNKLDKLLVMLDEVDRRYKQYYHQMQILVSSFDTIAGCGAAKPYTTLALKTISRHFRSLKDSLSVQIQATRKSLGEQDSGQGGVIPRLRYVDQQLRQQRALQQFGMMRHAWRPQRGLPENAVTILRAWLFEHFLHPYPKDSEKSMLARQTGLTRSQVGNWFINARVRLWKPMVEEMYKEEFGEADLKIQSSPENASKPAEELSRTNEDWREEMQERFIVSSREGDDHKNKGPMQLNDSHHNLNNHGFYPHDQNGLMEFQAPEVGRFGVNNHVSLALGLRRIDGASAENNGVGPESGEYTYFGQVSQQQHKLGNSHMLDDFVV